MTGYHVLRDGEVDTVDERQARGEAEERGSRNRVVSEEVENQKGLRKSKEGKRMLCMCMCMCGNEPSEKKA